MPKKRLSFFGKRVDPQTLSDFFDQLATLLTSGVPLLQALEFARTAARNRPLNGALQEVAAKIRVGSQLSEALALYPEIFDRVVLGMFKAAEASGHLEAVCSELSRSFAGRAEMRNRLFQALAYPALVASVGVITVSVLLVFVVPKLTAIFELWDAPLPFMTRALLASSRFLNRGGFLALILVFLGVLFYFRSVKIERRKQIFLSFAVKVPFIKRLFFLTDFVRLTRTWGMLLRSGVPLVEAIRSTKDVLWDPKLALALEALREKTIKGAALQEAVRQEKWFPELAHNFLSVGETTGTLDQSFEKIANFYERELDRKVRLIGTFLEPLLILAIGLVVGVLVISLLLPIFEMSLVVR